MSGLGNAYLRRVGLGQIDWEKTDIKALLLYNGNKINEETSSLKDIPLGVRATRPVSVGGRRMLHGGVAKATAIVFPQVAASPREVDTMCIFVNAKAEGESTVIGTWGRDKVDIFPFMPNGADVVIEVESLFQL